MFLSMFRPALAAALLLGVPIVINADAPAASERLVYVKPDFIPGDITRVDAKEGRDGNSRIPEHLRPRVLSPEHTGVTVQEHPSIFWYLNEPAKGLHYKFSISKDGDPEPIYEKVLDAEKDIGIQRLNLSDVAKGLEIGPKYSVVVAVMNDQNPSSKDRVSSAVIQRIAASDKLVSHLLTRPTPGERAAVYVRQGIWYDALAAISDQIAANPNDKHLHDIRADLLKQGHLLEAAAYDESLGK